MKEQMLALCYILIKEIDSRPFGFPNANDENSSDRKAVIDFAIHLIRYGHP
jgi:hypothetical protein